MHEPPSPQRSGTQDSAFRQRILSAAEAVLKKQTTVGLLDVLVAARFVHLGHVEEWRRGNPAAISFGAVAGTDAEFSKIPVRFL